MQSLDFNLSAILGELSAYLESSQSALFQTVPSAYSTRLITTSTAKSCFDSPFETDASTTFVGGRRLIILNVLLSPAFIFSTQRNRRPEAFCGAGCLTN